MGHKINGHAPSLDARIAAVLASAEVNKDELVSLLHEADAALAEAQATIETETANALDIANPDPDASDALVQKAGRISTRLQLAIPKLRDRIRAIDAFEYREAWYLEADEVQARGDKSAERLKHYAKFVTWLEAEFAEIDDINAAIQALHARAPAGEDRRLLEPELLARGLSNYDREHPRLRELLRLPKWDRSSEIAFPPNPMDQWNRRAAQANEALTQRMIEKGALVTGDTWHAGRDLAVEQEEVVFAQRAAELKQQESENKAAFERKLLENDKRRRTGETR